MQQDIKIIDAPEKPGYDHSYAGILLSEQRVFVPKGWGYEDWIWNGTEYCGKLLFVKQGKQCSWHYHNKKDETFYIHSGQIELFYGQTDDMTKCQHRILVAGDAFHVPRLLRHRFRAILDTQLFEFSTQHFDDDSIRVEKGD